MSPARLLKLWGTFVFIQERAFWRNDAGDGEDGASPSRCRHCKRGVTLQHATVRFGAWEGAGTRRSASQDTQPAVDSTQPFEHKGGFS